MAYFGAVCPEPQHSPSHEENIPQKAAALLAQFPEQRTEKKVQQDPEPGAWSQAWIGQVAADEEEEKDCYSKPVDVEVLCHAALLWQQLTNTHYSSVKKYFLISMFPPSPF